MTIERTQHVLNSVPNITIWNRVKLLSATRQATNLIQFVSSYSSQLDNLEELFRLNEVFLKIERIKNSIFAFIR